MPLEHLVGGLFATPDWRLNSYLMTEGKIFHFFELHLVTDLSKHDLLWCYWPAILFVECTERGKYCHPITGEFFMAKLTKAWWAILNMWASFTEKKKKKSQTCLASHQNQNKCHIWSPSVDPGFSPRVKSTHWNILTLQRTEDVMYYLAKILNTSVKYACKTTVIVLLWG